MDSDQYTYKKKTCGIWGWAPAWQKNAAVITAKAVNHVWIMSSEVSGWKPYHSVSYLCSDQKRCRLVSAGVKSQKFFTCEVFNLSLVFFNWKVCFGLSAWLVNGCSVKGSRCILFCVVISKTCCLPSSWNLHNYCVVFKESIFSETITYFGSFAVSHHMCNRLSASTWGQEQSRNLHKILKTRTCDGCKQPIRLNNCTGIFLTDQNRLSRLTWALHFIVGLNSVTPLYGDDFVKPFFLVSRFSPAGVGCCSASAHKSSHKTLSWIECHGHTWVIKND